MHRARFSEVSSCSPALCLAFQLIANTAQRPDIYPPVFRVEKSNHKKIAPGYIFITPYEAKNPGPYIFDNKGVWLDNRKTMRPRLETLRTDLDVNRS